MGRGTGRGGDFEDAPGSYCFACGCCTLLFISCFLLGFSFDTLAPNRMSFVYDANVHKMEFDELYNENNGDGGRFFLGLGRTFLYPFPREVQRLLFSNENGADSGIITAKDSEGIDVTIACSLQYSLKRGRGDLQALFARYGSLDIVAASEDPEAPPQWGWNPFYIQHARGVVRDVMAQYNATSLWQSRVALAADMRTALTAKLDGEYAVLRGFQLLNMDIPAALQTSILATTVEQEAVKRARENLRAINETVITDVAVQSRLAEIDLLIAQAQATEVAANAQAANESLRLQVGAEVDAVTALKASLNLNTTEYLSLLYMDTVATAGADAVNVGLTQPSNTQG